MWNACWGEAGAPRGLLQRLTLKVKAKMYSIQRIIPSNLCFYLIFELCKSPLGAPVSPQKSFHAFRTPAWVICLPSRTYNTTQSNTIELLGVIQNDHVSDKIVEIRVESEISTRLADIPQPITGSVTGVPGSSRVSRSVFLF